MVVIHVEGVCETIQLTYVGFLALQRLSFLSCRVVGGFDVLNSMEKIETDDKDHPTVSQHCLHSLCCKVST